MAQTTSRKATELKTRTVSSNEAKQHWGSMMDAASSGETVIVQSHGKPKTVMISFEEYQEVEKLREKQRRAEALEGLRRLQAAQRERNKDLTPEQAEELANRFAHEFFDELAAEGKLRFERDST